MFERKEVMVICTTIYAILHNITTHKRGPWEIEVVVNLRDDILAIHVVVKKIKAMIFIMLDNFNDTKNQQNYDYIYSISSLNNYMLDLYIIWSNDSLS